MTYLLDTCILSKLRKLKKHPDALLEQWINSHSEAHYYLSVLTIGEIQKGIALAKDTAQKRILNNWLWGELIPRFNDRIINIETKVMTRWGEIYGAHQKRGLKLPSIDSLIAATAITHDLILVTENSKDFSRVEGLQHFNPWIDQLELV